MPRFLTKIELLEGELPFLIKALVAKNSDDLKNNVIPNLPDIKSRKYRILNENVRMLDDDNTITSGKSMLGYA